MSKASQTTSHASASTYDVLEGLLSPSEKKRLRPSVFSRLLGFARRNLFLSSIVISLVLTGIMAGSVYPSYTRDKQDPYLYMPSNWDGVSDVTSPSCVLTDYVSQVVLFGAGYGFDATGQTMSIRWQIMGCGTYNIAAYPVTDGITYDVGCDALDRAADVYLNRWAYIRCRLLRSTY